MTVADFQIWFTFALVAAVIVSYALERVPLEVTSIAALAALLVFFHIFPVPGEDGRNLLDLQALLGGFASPALASIMALMVVGQALYQTGAIEGPARWLSRGAARSPLATTAVTMVAVAAISAFMNNTPLVVVMIPVVGALAARLGTGAGGVMMPLSFITILGGMTTLVGSSTNLVVAGIAEDHSIPLGFFDPSMPGVILAAAGALYVIFVMPRLLGPREDASPGVAGPAGRQFIAEIEIARDHALAGAQSHAGLFPDLRGMTVRLIQRGRRTILPPFEDVRLATGDVIIVAATRAAITDALTGRQAILTPGNQPVPASSGDSDKDDLVLVEAMIAPGSRLVGRPANFASLGAETGTTVIAIQRRRRMARQPVRDIRIEDGDVILLLGHHDDMSRLTANRDIVLLEWSQTELPRMRLAGRAVAILAATMAAAALDLVPIAIAAIAGALAMIASGCLNIRQAARAFDRRIYLLIGASLALAAPLEATGAAALVAGGVIDLMAGFGPVALLAALFGLVALFTNILSNHATAALFTPIAISAAAQTGADPAVFALTVIYAANCSFATPMAYQTNLLVMGPGRYRVVDFMRAGTPLIVILWLVYCLVVPWYFGL